MNDAQTDKLLEVLADTFDRAAVHCMTNKEAARFILADLIAAGYKLERRQRRARVNSVHLKIAK